MSASPDIFRRAKQGDQLAWKELVVTEGRNLYERALRKTGSREDAEDAMQESWLRFYGRIDKINVDDNPAGYLQRTVGTTVIDMQRKRVKLSPYSLDVLRDGTTTNADSPAYRSPTDLERQVEVTDEAMRVLAQLSPLERIIFVRRAEGLRDAEIGAEVGLTSSAVRKKVFRAKQRLTST